VVREVSHILLVDMTGVRVGKLLVIARAPNKNATACWKCRCDCKRIVVTYGYTLRQAQRRGKELCCQKCRNPSAPRTVPRVHKKHGKLNICEECGNMPHRVEGPPGTRCPGMGASRGKCTTIAGSDKPIVPPWRAVS